MDRAADLSGSAVDSFTWDRWCLYGFGYYTTENGVDCNDTRCMTARPMFGKLELVPN